METETKSLQSDNKQTTLERQMLRTK